MIQHLIQSQPLKTNTAPVGKEGVDQAQHYLRTLSSSELGAGRRDLQRLPATQQPAAPAEQTPVSRKNRYHRERESRGKAERAR